jgi:serine/threonine protein phosphatase 1
MRNFLNFEKNVSGTDYFIGDIHGEISALKKALNAIRFNESKDRLFSVGDLVDRGEDSMEVLRFFRDSPWFHAVRGNHEDMLKKVHENDWPLDNYLINGGKWYFVLSPEEKNEAYDIVKDLPIVIKAGDVGVVHAQPLNNWESMVEGIIHGNENNLEMYVMWGRDVIRGTLPFNCDGIGKVFCGHTVIKTPVNRGNVKFIDTGAVFGGKLTICNSDGIVVYPFED